MKVMLDNIMRWEVLDLKNNMLFFSVVCLIVLANLSVMSRHWVGIYIHIVSAR